MKSTWLSVDLATTGKTKERASFPNRCFLVLAHLTAVSCCARSSEVHYFVDRCFLLPPPGQKDRGSMPSYEEELQEKEFFKVRQQH